MAEKLKNKNRKEQLNLNDNWFRELYEYSPLMYFIIDSDGYVLSANEKGAEVLGYKRNELLGQQVLDVFHPDDKKLVLKQIKKCLKEPKDIHNWEFRKIRKDGSMLWVKESARVISEDDRRFLFIICEDISEQKRAEADLKEKLFELAKKNRYETIIRTVTQSVHQSIDLQEVMENAVEALGDNIDNTDCVSIYIIEGETAVLKCHVGYPDLLLKNITRIPKPKGFTWQTLIEGKPRYCSDVEKDKAIGPAGREAGTKSYVSMPIKYHVETIGCININSRTLDAFDEEEIKLLQVVANQIETAINNAKQAEALKKSEEALQEKLGELSKKNKYEEIISAVTRSVHQSINLEEVFKNAVEAMSKNMERANIVEIYSIEDKKAVLKSHIGYKKTYIKQAGSIPYPKGFIWKTAIDKKPVYCPDTDKDKIIGPAGRDAGIKTYLSMPIRFEGKVFGVIGINSFQKHAFDEKELKLLEIVAKQIETAINNARHAHELKESEGKLLKNLEQLSRKKRYEEIISTVTRSVHSSINFQDVLENAVESLSKNMVIAQHVSILMIEGDEAVLKAYRGLPKWFVERLGKIPYPKGFAWKVLTEGKPRYCPDVDQDEYIGPAGREVGTKSYLSVPFNYKGNTIGCISLHSFEKNAFSDDEISLVGLVAQQIEVAIQNAKQAEALRESEDTLKEKLNALSKKNRYETIIRTVTQSVHQSTELQEVLENAVEAMSKNIAVIEIIGIYIVEGTEAVLRAHRAHPDWFVERMRRIPHPKGFTWKTIMEGKPIYCEDVDKDESIGPAGKEVGTKSYLSMPIQHNNETIGCINIISHEKKAFSQEDIDLVELVAHQIEVAISNARQTEALRESEERYRTLYDQSPVGVFTFDKDYKITSSNKRLFEIMKLSSEGIYGLELKKLQDQKFTYLYEKALEGHPAQHENFYMTTRSKIKLWLSISAVPLRDADGNILGGMAVVEDVTRRKEMEERLGKSQKLESLGILAGGIAHDFNNLLTSIMGNLSIAKTNPHIGEELLNLIRESEHATERAAVLVSQLLTFSKGGAPVKRLFSNFSDFISDIVNFTVSGSLIRCEFSTEDNLWNLEVDQVQISQVIENLVINAKQAMPEGGTINVSVKNYLAEKNENNKPGDGKYIRITIEDSGIGIPEENLNKIFDPYFTTKENGHGLGLSSVYSIIKYHAGYIDVESHPGMGTKFQIYLPASDKFVQANTSPRMKISKGRGKILLMDDENLIKIATGRMLKKMGYEVEYASDGQEAVNKYKQSINNGRFDLVIMDLTIPGGMGGCEATKILRSIDPDVKVVVSSGYSNDPVMSDYKNYGFVDIVKKPYSLEALSNTIESVMNGETL